MSNKQPNPLLVKIQVGKPKISSYKLPDINHVYGKCPPKDKEGAREVTMSWNSHTQSMEQIPNKDFRKINAIGIQNGFVSAKEITKFQNNVDIRVPVKHGNATIAINLPEEDFIFGIKNKSFFDKFLIIEQSFRPHTPFHNIIQNNYASREEKSLEQVSPPSKLFNQVSKSQSVLKTIPVGQEITPQERLNQENKSKFVLKKFQNVPSRVFT